MPRQTRPNAFRDRHMDNYFESPFSGVTLDKQVTNPNIVVGRFSYYSGYYHGHSFEDCARYLLPDEGVDRLIVGSFCSIGSGAAFSTATLVASELLSIADSASFCIARS